MFLAVYGTLKSEERNHYLLNEDHVTYIGTEFSKHLKMFDVDVGYPIAVKEPSSNPDGVLIEVYEIGMRVLEDIDLLEGYNHKAPTQGLYNRVIIPTQYCPNTNVYVYNGKLSKYKREIYNWSEVLGKTCYVNQT